MSGGYFDYEQEKIDYIADLVEHLIKTNDDKSLDEWGVTRGRDYPPEVIAEFRKGLHYLRVAAVYTQRIDWLLCGDDGEECFLDRLHKDLSKLGLPQEEAR
jgi:hypothetical protein